MNNNNSVLIISNDETKGSIISDKIKLLRDCDDIKTVTYIESISVLNSQQPSIIVVFSANADYIGIVKEIRSLKNLDKVPIILAMNSFDEDSLLYAFDNGIDDFFFMQDADSVILMRILWALQKSILYNRLEMYDDILVSSGIIDRLTGIYSSEKASLVLNTFFDKIIEKNLKNSIFMCVKPILKQQKKGITQGIMQSIETIIKQIPRGNDIIAFGKNSTYYIVLHNSGIIGAKSVFQRIKNTIANDYDLFVSAAEITNSFDEMEPVLLKSIDNQINVNIEFNFLYSLNTNEMSFNTNLQDNSEYIIKDLKKELYNELEKIISPVFYQMRTKILDVFPKSNVNFDITDNDSKFIIADDAVTSEVIITYQSFTNISVDVKHTKKLKQPQLKRMTFNFDIFSSEKLLEIIKDVVQEYALLRLNIDTSENEYN